MNEPYRVVIVGGSVVGLNAVRGLRRAPVPVTLVDRHNFHLFHPLLYQVARGGLSPSNNAAPLRSIFRRQQNVKVLLPEVVDVDVAGRRVVLWDGYIAHDMLRAAAGAQPSYFGHDQWQRLAPGLKTN